MEQRTIDASVVIARILREPRPPWIDDVAGQAQAGELRLVAPSFIWLEIGNRLSRAPELADEFALEAMLRVEALSIDLVHESRPLRLRALAAARTYGLSMYDAAYLAVAEVAGAPLLTLDRRLDAAATAMGLSRDGGSPKVSEPAAPYGDRPVHTTSLAAIGQALAEMRREYST